MAGFDADVFGQPAGKSAGFDEDVFATPKAAPMRSVAPAPVAAPAAPAMFSMDKLRQEVGTIGDIVAGGVKGASNIGATLLTPVDWLARKAGIENSVIGRQDRRQAVTESLRGMGADTNATGYKAGELGAEIAGTAGIGGALGTGIRALPQIGRVGNAIATGLETGGFSVPGLSRAPALATRMATGGAVGALTAGAVNPDDAATGMMVGGVLPPAVQVAGKAGQALSGAMQSGANRLMQSALKPTLAQLRSGDARTATQVMLEKGLNPNAAGVEKLGGMIDDVDSRLSAALAGSNAQVDKQKVLQALNGTRSQFATQATPQADLQAIQAAQDAFMAHPIYSGPTIPVQDAQALKQGTYRVLAKKYGQIGSADTEAQKALARGLKDEIAAAVPEVSGFNADLSRFLTAKEVMERRALMDGNKNPAGLALLAPSKGALLGFLADRSAQLKALSARGLYSAAPAGRFPGLLDNPALLPYARAGLLANESSP